MITQLTFFQLRMNRSLSLEQVAEDLGITPKEAEKAEKNNEGMNSVLFHRLCKYYGISAYHVHVGPTINGMPPNLLVIENTEYSRKAISLALQSEHGERLDDIENIVSIMRTVLTSENLLKQEPKHVADTLFTLQKLETERDSILQPFQDQVDKVEQEKKIVELERFIEEFGGDLDEIRAIINKSRNEKITPAATLGKEASVI